MFTGIIRYTGKIIRLKTAGQGKRFEIEADKDLLQSIEEGITSIAVNGACLTVEKAGLSNFTVFAAPETLRRTNLGRQKVGSRVNLELPLTPNSLLNGHIVQGHIDGIGWVVTVRKQGEVLLYTLEAPPEIQRFLVEKDSIAIDGISLTIFDIRNKYFDVSVIPETIAKTTLPDRKPRDPVNLEVNIFAKYAYRFNKESKNSDTWIQKFEP